MLSPFPFLDLHTWYLKNGRQSLPWRNYNYDKKQLWYRAWLAETMLQQTQVKRVKEYFHNILDTFPTVEDLAQTSYEDFFPYYKWLGYYSRARNMLKTAQMVVSDFWGIFPEDSKSLITLAWVWPYTAEAIRAFAYNESTLSFDTNLEKIFSRYYHGNKFRKLTKDEKQQILSDFQKSWISGRDINNALMDYGATISLNNISAIDWKNYPFPSSKFFQTRWELEPVKEKKKSTFPNKQAFVITILHENHKVYFSKNSEFTPFLIWKNTGNPRAMIQEYFLSNHWLELSVRPPEIKSYNQCEIPYMVCYAQIQSWKHNFQSFKWLKVRGFEEGFVEELEFEKSSLF
jgi:A/G-specific adenine glycosylase